MAPEAEAGLLRARRLEIVDDQGRVRAAIAADRDPFGGDVIVGLELLDEEGSARAWIADMGGAAQLGLALAGNQVAVLQSISHDDSTSTVALLLCDASGRPVVRWAVQSDGTYSASIEGEPTPGS